VFAALQHTMPLKNSLLFPAIQSVHMIGIGLLVGSIVVTDLRRLGFTLRGHSIAEVAMRFMPFRQAGLAIMLTTGPILFASDVTRYVHNPAFLFKMAVLLFALIFQFTLHSSFERRSKLVACVSIALWTCVVLGGRAIADFDI
jgi:hypothetical protein